MVHGFGIIGDIVVGVLVGGFLFEALGVSTGGGFFATIAMATFGAVVLISC